VPSLEAGTGADPQRRMVCLRDGGRSAGLPAAEYGRRRSQGGDGSAMTTADGSDPGAVILYVSTNGVGLGHLTRLMALARRASSTVRPYFVSMSQAVPIVAMESLDYEYIPSRGDLGVGSRRWNGLFRRRFLDIVERERPAAVIFDGTYPYDGLFAGRSGLPDVQLIWSRRGMWRPHSSARQLARSHQFDLVIEPGDFAEEADNGPTADRTDALRVPPIVLLDRDELLSRDQAAAMLGVDPARPTALVMLGGGGIGDHSLWLGRLARRLLEIDRFQVVVTRSAIASYPGGLPDGVHPTSVYPVSQALKAVDLAVAAAGYNAFHELLAFSVPAAFVPNTAAALDHQPARAAWAEKAGVGICIEELDEAAIERIAAELGDPLSRSGIANRCARLPVANGAWKAQQAVEDLITAGGS
jgi:Glycosyltransferase family 28 C-terminal domain